MLSETECKNCDNERNIFLQVKYKEAGKKEASSSLYHQLPETLETQHVKEVTELQSKVHTSIIHIHLSTFHEVEY